MFKTQSYLIDSDVDCTSDLWFKILFKCLNSTVRYYYEKLIIISYCININGSTVALINTNNIIIDATFLETDGLRSKSFYVGIQRQLIIL